MTMQAPLVLITGGARGIGEAASRIFARNGFRVRIFDVLETEGRKVSEAIEQEHGDARFARCDVSIEDEVARAVGDVVERDQRIDVLVNNAGTVLVKPLAKTNWTEYRRVVDTNLGGTFLLCKHVLQVMKRQKEGAIVNVASVSGHVGQVDHVLYGATKGAILSFTRALAWEVSPYNIRVNSVSPGSVDTAMLRGDIEIESARIGRPAEDVKKAREAEQAFKRWAEPSEIAAAIHFLASSAASFITGADLLVDCGWTAR